MTYGAFIASRLGGLRLDVGEMVAAFPEMSTREIAKVAGVSNYTVAIEKQAVRNLTPDAEPARVVGVDGKSYPGRVVREVTAQVIETEEPRAVIAASRAPTPRHASHATGNAAPRCACESSSCASHGVGAPSGSRRSWLRRGYAGWGAVVSFGVEVHRADVLGERAAIVKLGAGRRVGPSDAVTPARFKFGDIHG